MFDPETGVWLTLDPLPSARHGLASVAVGGRWFVIGGATLAGGQTFVSLTGTVHIFEPGE